MKFFLVLVVMVGAGLVDQGDALSKCKEEIIDKIKKSWGTKAPEGSIAQLKADGQQTVVGTSKDYFAGAKAFFPGLEKPELKCVFGIYKTDKYDITLVPKEGKPVTQGFKVEIKPGGEAIFETQGKKLKRYAFFFGEGVVGLYGCNDEGASPDDTPDAIIKVTKGYKKENVDAAKKKAKELLGIDITETYPDKCKAKGGEGGEKGGEEGGKKEGGKGGKKEGGEGGKTGQ